ncbi:MAG: hypothetical protein IPK13_21600 [Deltaproteobacteria bacterium]|nr:hypothetical protein [Deltaproteobacteria bacterium]
MFLDGLLFFGNIRAAYRWLRDQTEQEIATFFKRGIFDDARMCSRGGYLDLSQIAREELHLNSEIAQKFRTDELNNLVEAWKKDRERRLPDILAAIGKDEAKLAIHSLSERVFENTSDLRVALDQLGEQSSRVRKCATENTNLYLSMVDDLDVYVATSMREAQHFEQTAERCSRIFGAANLKELNLRYFDPTLSAAERPEDKGLIECLMVKCAKVLVYFAGDRDSFGKDAEAAMALSLGKPVIVLCDSPEKATLYRDIHPLARLIDFSTGVAVGMLATSEEAQVPLLLERIFTNSMEYELSNKDGYLTLRDTLTRSIVRLQTNSKLLTETFWNHYCRTTERVR